MRSLLFLLAAVPTALHGQGAYVLTPFAARNASLPGTPTLVGLSFARYTGAVGIRGGAAIDGTRVSSIFGPRSSSTAWAADIDAVFSPGRLPVVGTLLAGFVPAVFAGVGAQGMRAEDAGSDERGGSTSYGVSVSRSILGSVGIETEARRRVPFAWGGGQGAGFDRGWEYRVGVSISFGGGGDSRGRPRIPGMLVP